MPIEAGSETLEMSFALTAMGKIALVELLAFILAAADNLTTLDTGETSEVTLRTKSEAASLPVYWSGRPT
jgi:hypothetical protein